MTPAFTITITADSPEQLHANLRAMLPDDGPITTIGNTPFQDLLIRIAERADAEGYDMEVWKKGERETKPVEELPQAARKKEEARAKLRGELVASLAEATHATAAVKEEIEDRGQEVKSDALNPLVVETADTPPEKPKRGRPPKSANGAAETPDALKARTIIKLQELYSAGKKAEVNKLLAQYGDGSKTFSSIPAEQFGPIAEAAEAI